MKRTRLPEAPAEQELNILVFIVDGETDQQVADERVVTVTIDKWYVHKVFQKPGIYEI